ncbi:ABC transporter substrate-binding protein [Paenibacillus sp. 32O-W]|uniref:extracellular solute-binding protein n=1 Tax=Paenibacillus sp. 32O-W TaxID=1695218 RepID=UPI0007222811|nr:extracellular solute-binding protein [Paenibacillus sp. 32O-W]ALS26608.1 ABC transporter substrate-binding protein [Paenibacillus sp. 32O-W]
MKRSRIRMWLLGGLALALALMTACSNTNPSGSGGAEGGEKPLDIRIMTLYYTPEPPGKDNVIVKEVEKRTNTKLDITWVSPNSYGDKVNVTLASGDIPDLMLLDNPFTPQVRTMVEQGAFWDITDYIKDYPNLSKYPEESWVNTKQADGRNYGVPRVRPVEGGGFIYLRKDWIDKLGLQVPATTDELYTVLKAFVEQDPDGNGQKDTIGYAGFVDQQGMALLGQLQNVFTGANGDWKLVDGKLVNVNVLPEMREALVWLSNAYKEKLLPEDLAVLKNTQAKDLLKAGRAGGFQDTVEAAWEPTQELRKTNPEADFLPLVSLNGYVNRDSGYFGIYAIPKSVPEEKMKKLLAFLDYGASDEGHELAWYGLPGVHHTVEDGIYVMTEQAEKDIVAQQAFGQIFGKYDKYQRAYRVGMPKDVLERNKRIIDERAEVSVPDVAVGLFSDTDVKVGAELRKKIQDMKTKVILGKEPIEAWDAFVWQLKKDPDLLKITEEMNAAYQKRNSGS